LQSDLSASQSLTVGAAEAFRGSVNAPVLPAGTAPDLVLGSALSHIEATDALRQVCSSAGVAPQLAPRFPQQLAASLFPTLWLPQALEAVEGLVAGLSVARGADA